MLDRYEIKRICLNDIKSVWMKVPDSFPTFLTEISTETKMHNELYIQTISDDFQKAFKSFPVRPNGRKKWKEKMFHMIEDVVCNEIIFGIHNYMDSRRIGTFQDEIKGFLAMVRSFAPELPMDDIGQAMRNYIVYAVFVEINKVNPGLNPACFAYSMLYPFTDNYIDCQNHSDKEKSGYNQIIRNKIEGKHALPKSLHQQKTCKLISMIEEEYPRDQDSSVFMLLDMMLEAQEDSLRQQNKDFALSYEERLDISLYKGGISVLIDRFLVKKETTKDDLNFYLAFGFFLQLADDLQDIKEDSIQGHQTILTADLNSCTLEKNVNKMFHFVHQIMTNYHIENELFREFLLSSCYQLICSSVIGSKEFFSEKYLEEIEKYMPVSCAFLENMRKRQTDNLGIKGHEKYMKILDELIC